MKKIIFLILVSLLLTLFLIIIILSTIFLNSCFFRKPVEIILSEKKLELSKKITVIMPKNPLVRKRKINYLGIKLNDKWNLYNYEKGQIKLIKSGKIATINVKIIDQSGNYGTSGCYLSCATLPYEGAKIVKIEISSSENIFCNKIIWHCYDPI
ncbi:hypothetical protein AAEX28_15985 [Lentisphaerota bacterium WC36G]|nr:hypothetical protein LJT99_02745 [Lentisphaerae bacterium WC36]